MGRETVKTFLDDFLEDYGIDTKHELYEVFDSVFRLGLTWGGDYDKAVIRTIWRNEYDGYLYVINNGSSGIVIEDDSGNIISAGGIR